MQANVEKLTTENERLTSALVASQAEIARLSAIVGTAGLGVVPGSGIAAVGAATGVPVSMGVATKASAGPPSERVSATGTQPSAPTQQRASNGGYGY